MQRPNPHPPAVVRGLPKAAIRFGLRGVALPIGVVFCSIAAVLVAIELIPVSLTVSAVLLATFGIVVLGLPALIGFALTARYAYRFQRFVTELAANPRACLNCGYPTVDAAGICAECAHHSDRTQLNRQWRANLASLAPDPDGGPARRAGSSSR